MSQENVDAIRSGTELWLRGEYDAWLETLAPDIGWDISAHPLPDVPDFGEGRESFVTDMLGTYVSGWNDYVVEIAEVATYLRVFQTKEDALEAAGLRE